MTMRNLPDSPVTFLLTHTLTHTKRIVAQALVLFPSRGPIDYGFIFGSLVELVHRSLTNMRHIAPS